jgi:hypothetical protein
MKWRQSENGNSVMAAALKAAAARMAAASAAKAMAAWRGYGVNISNNVAATAAWQWRKTKMAAIVKRKYRNGNNGGMVAATWRNRSSRKYAIMQAAWRREMACINKMAGVIISCVMKTAIIRRKRHQQSESASKAKKHKRTASRCAQQHKPYHLRHLSIWRRRRR